MTDAHDRRTLMSILEVFYSEDAVLNDSYRCVLCGSTPRIDNLVKDCEYRRFLLIAS